MDFSLDSWEKLGAAVGVAAAVFGVLGAVARRLIQSAKAFRTRRAAASGLPPDLYPSDTIGAATRYYVQHSVQSVDPDSAADEPGLMVASREAAFHALDRILCNPSQFRYIVILAGSGMGKSSLLLNYYAKHRQKRRRPFEIALVPLGVPDADSRISLIDRKPETVLFLDALDEDARAVKNHKDRLKEISTLTSSFKKVVITCRTQFFSSAEEEPGDAGMIRVTPRRAGEPAGWRFHKLYLSPFDSSDVKKYMSKRFPWWKRGTRRRAEELINKIPHLVVRPMLLAYVDDLLREPGDGLALDGLYAAMIDAWLTREEGILPGVEKAPLYEFSRKVAVNLWLFRAIRGAERIPGNEIGNLAQEYGIPLESWQLTSRSLLNRDTSGNYKFAHRSILEFLIVLEFLAGNRDCWTIDWTDQMHKFLSSLAESTRLNGPVEYGRMPVRLVGLEFPGIEPPGLRKLRKAYGNDVGTFDSIDVPDRTRRIKGGDVPHLLLPDEPEDSQNRRTRWHFVEEAHSPSANGRVFSDHSEGLLWYIPNGEPTTLTKARQHLARLDQSRFFGQSGWRFATSSDFERCPITKPFTRDWYIVDTTRPAAKSTEWSLAIQLYRPDGHIACIARPTDADLGNPTKGSRYRCSYVCDL
jgi:hypothetical protein